MTVTVSLCASQPICSLPPIQIRTVGLGCRTLASAVELSAHASLDSPGDRIQCSIYLEPRSAFHMNPRVRLHCPPAALSTSAPTSVGEDLLEEAALTLTCVLGRPGPLHCQ